MFILVSSRCTTGPSNPDLLPAPLVYHYSASVVCFYSALDKKQTTELKAVIQQGMPS
jgi:hypothetical protein